MPNDTAAAILAARSKEQEMNGTLIYTPDNAAQNDPPHKVYIWNVGPTKHVVEKGSAGIFTIPACAPDAGISEPLVLPSIVRDSYFVEQEMKTHSVTGDFMAQDIVRPTIGGSWSFGQNLDELGVFWTRNNPPTEAEVAAARERMEKTYRKLLGMAAGIEATGRLDDITPLMRIAASYFGEDRPWNKIYRKTIDCPGCGEPMKQGIIRHPCGYVVDPDKALLAGMIDKETHEGLVELRNAEAGVATKRKK